MLNCYIACISNKYGNHNTWILPMLSTKQSRNTFTVSYKKKCTIPGALRPWLSSCWWSLCPIAVHILKITSKVLQIPSNHQLYRSQIQSIDHIDKSLLTRSSCHNEYNFCTYKSPRLRLRTAIVCHKFSTLPLVFYIGILRKSIYFLQCIKYLFVSAFEIFKLLNFIFDSCKIFLPICWLG